MTPEEALRHAYSADLARLPQHMRGQFDAGKLAQSRLAGKPDQSFHAYMEIGSPAFPAETDGERQLQDSFLPGYTGKGWTPSQRQQLGREPQPYELSPGAKMADQIKARQELYGAFDPPKKEHWLTAMFGGPGAWTGSGPDKLKEGAAKLYADQLGPDGQGRTHNYLPGTGPGTMIPGVPDEDMFSMFSNPENFVGTFATKMSPVISDGLSQIGTSLLRGNGAGEKLQGVANALPNAAVRSYGADWYRTSPQLAHEPKNWREADTMIDKNRAAFNHSQGMSAGETSRTLLEPILPEDFKGQIPVIQPLVNGALSFGNGMLDGTGLTSATKLPGAIVGPVARAAARTSVPGVAKFAASTADDIAKYSKLPFGQRLGFQATDEALDVGNIAGTLQQFAEPADQRTSSEFEQAMQQQDQYRKQSLKQLESDQNQIIRPKPYGFHGMADRVLGNAPKKAGDFLGGLIR